MKNINLLINILLDIMEFEGLDFERISIDDGGATEEAEVHYHINCPFTSDDEEAMCYGSIDINREQCVKCKYNFLLKECNEE